MILRLRRVQATPLVEIRGSSSIDAVTLHIHAQHHSHSPTICSPIFIVVFKDSSNGYIDSPMSTRLYNALIRTHHITSRKKVAKLKQAADDFDCRVLIHYGGPPGIMYCAGREEGVKQWVDSVNRLRYKDYHLVARPSPVVPEGDVLSHTPTKSEFEEVTSVKEFGEEMRRHKIHDWWRRAMGYTT